MSARSQTPGSPSSVSIRKLTSGTSSTKISSSSPSTQCCWAKRGGFFPTHGRPRVTKRYPFRTMTSPPARMKYARGRRLLQLGSSKGHQPKRRKTSVDAGRLLVVSPRQKGATATRASWLQRSAPFRVLWQGQSLRHVLQEAPAQRLTPALWTHQLL